ncbi:MAG: phosphotransferase enzyme family protein [Candidatus Thorarchaeota archaeon]
MGVAEQVSYLTFLRRLRKLAEMALASYELEGADLKFINYSGNGLYQVRIPKERFIAPGKYALRLHQPDYMKPEHICSEMEWLSALHNAGIQAPMPKRNLTGDWLTVTEGDFSVPQQRNCTLIGWTEGQILGEKVRPKHFRSLGRLIGRLHEHSRKWKPPKGFARPHWNWDGLYGEGFSYGAPAADAREAIPKVHQTAFNRVLDILREVSETLGRGKDVYGLIHADLGLAENVAFLGGEAKPFDFDDCGFGYWVFDIAVPLSQHFIDTGDRSKETYDSLKSGYEETSSLEGIGIEYLNHFIAARLAQFMFFYQASGMAHPQYMEASKQGVNEHAKYLKKILKEM